MKHETRFEGSYDARTSASPAKGRERWAEALTEQLRERGALAVFDARERPLPEHLRARLTEPDIRAFETFLDDTFGPDWKKHTTGRTFAMSYLKYGHGHKHQATDLALQLSHITGSRVVLFDPMEALPNRERDIMLRKKKMHKALQDRDTEFLKALRSEVAKRPDGPLFWSVIDHMTNKSAYVLAELAIEYMPAQEETGNVSSLDEPSRIAAMVSKIVDSNPLLVVRAFAKTEQRLTERSVAAATTAIAAEFGADAILTTHPATIRAMTPDVLPWLPKRLWKDARHALQTIFTITPDNGYTKRKPDGKDTDLTPAENMEDMAISEPFAFATRGASWLKRALHIVADEVVADRFHSYWNIPRSSYLPFGTVADSVTTEQFREKWAQPERRILIASNGNGSNLTDAIRAIREISAASTTWLTDQNFHLDIFAADFPDKIPHILEAAEAAGMADQVELIDYTNDWYNQGKLFSYSPDPAKRIHIAWGMGDAAGSDLKQWMQRKAHIEVRSPGENALSGAYVGTLELCTPPGGPNEIYNMIWAAREGLAYPVNWTADTNAPIWQTAGLTQDHGLLPDTETATFPGLVMSVISDNRADSLAENAYRSSNKQTGYAIIGMLIGELLRRDRHPAPSRETLAQRNIDYVKQRNTIIAQQLTTAS